MSNNKLNPRQRMINMMYLVLTAMLALNVSAEILKAFFLVETSMNHTGETLEARNEMLLAKLQKGRDHDPIRVGPLYEKALKAKQITDDLNAYIENLKKSLIDQTHGRESEGDFKGQLVGRENTEKHAFMLVSQQGPKKGQELRTKMLEAKAKLMQLIGPDARQISALTDLGYDMESNQVQSWESRWFEGAPLAAVVALLQKLQNDTRSAECEVMAYLYDHITTDLVTVDQLEAVVTAPSGYVAVGEPYAAKIFVQASSSTLQPEFFLNGNPLQSSLGVAEFKQTATEGEHNYSGMVRVKKPNGEVVNLPFKGSYTGFSGSSSVEPEKMNVVYAGLDNPMQISAPGFTPGQLVINASAGVTVEPDRNTPGRYFMKVASGYTGNLMEVKVFGRRSDGSLKPMGSQPFRVKRLPSPGFYINQFKGGTMNYGQVRALTSIQAGLGADFLYDGLTYRILSFRYYCLDKNQNPTDGVNEGPTFNGPLRNWLSKAKTNYSFSLFDFVVQYPDGTIKTVKDPTFTVLVK